MDRVRYEPLPTRIVYELHTHEGDYVVLFVPIETDQADIRRQIKADASTLLTRPQIKSA